MKIMVKTFLDSIQNKQIIKKIDNTTIETDYTGREFKSFSVLFLQSTFYFSYFFYTYIATNKF